MKHFLLVEENKSGEGKGGEYLEKKAISFCRKRKTGKEKEENVGEGRAYKISSCSQI